MTARHGTYQEPIAVASVSPSMGGGVVAAVVPRAVELLFCNAVSVCAPLEARCVAAAQPAIQGRAFISAYKKTHTCMCFSTLRNGREAVASISTVYGG